MPKKDARHFAINIPPPPDPPFDIDTFEPIEPPWQAIKQWIPADDDDHVAVAGVGDPGWDAHHRNESPWKPKEVPLGDDRILVLDAD
jgi:hypothetical protein